MLSCWRVFTNDTRRASTEVRTTPPNTLSGSAATRSLPVRTRSQYSNLVFGASSSTSSSCSVKSLYLGHAIDCEARRILDWKSNYLMISPCPLVYVALAIRATVLHLSSFWHLLRMTICGWLSHVEDFSIFPWNSRSH